MDELSRRLERARTDNAELEALISDYTPFIKKEIDKSQGFGIEYDDRLSIGFLVFMNCVRQYTPDKGAFLAFAAVSIRNRLIDEYRKSARNRGKVIPLFEDGESSYSAPENDASIAQYNREQESRALAEEIGILAEELDRFGIDYDQLTRLCPKQERSRRLSLNLAREVVGDAAMLEGLRRHKRLPKSELAKRFQISEKTVEKYRKYVVALAVILSGDYPSVGAFLPEQQEVRQR